MTAQKTFDEKITSDMFCYENLLTEAMESGHWSLIEDIKIVLSKIYLIVSLNHRKKTKMEKEKEKKREIKGKKVLAFNIETGESCGYSSIKEAAEKTGATGRAIGKAIATGVPMGGVCYDFEL